MRHLIDPMVCPGGNRPALTGRRRHHQKLRNILKFVKAKKQPLSMNQAPVPDSALNLP